MNILNRWDIVCFSYLLLLCSYKTYLCLKLVLIFCQSAELWDVLARQALEFHSLMCLTALTCRFPYMQWSCIIILYEYSVVAAQICKMGADEM